MHGWALMQVAQVDICKINQQFFLFPHCDELFFAAKQGSIALLHHTKTTGSCVAGSHAHSATTCSA